MGLDIKVLKSVQMTLLWQCWLSLKPTSYILGTGHTGNLVDTLVIQMRKKLPSAFNHASKIRCFGDVFKAPNMSCSTFHESRLWLFQECSHEPGRLQWPTFQWPWPMIFHHLGVLESFWQNLAAIDIWDWEGQRKGPNKVCSCSSKAGWAYW